MKRSLILELAQEAGFGTQITNGIPHIWGGEMETKQLEAFTKLVIEECRYAVATAYRRTPLEHCGYLLDADSEIVKRFYGEE